MAAKNSDEERAAWAEKVRQGTATETPEPTVTQSASDIDVLVKDQLGPDDFDPNGVYVVMLSALSLPRGPLGEFREPVYHGDLVSAAGGNGIYSLASSVITSPQDKNTIVQEASDGIERLRYEWEEGHVRHPSHPHAAEARRNRIRADASIPGGRKDASRPAEIRLDIIASGGRVADFAYGVKA